MMNVKIQIEMFFKQKTLYCTFIILVNIGTSLLIVLNHVIYIVRPQESSCSLCSTHSWPCVMQICCVCVCVCGRVCRLCHSLSLSPRAPSSFSSRLACYPLAWGGVWQRDNPCRYVPLTPRCSCLLRILGELGRLPLSLSLPLFSSATNIPADICFPSSLQSLWCLLVRHIQAQGVWKWFDLPLWKLHYLGHSPTLRLRGVMLDLQQVCEEPQRHWHQASLTSSDTNRNCSRPENVRQIWRRTRKIILVPLSFCISCTKW